MKLIRDFIRAVFMEAAEKEKKLLTEPDENEDREDDPADEFSGAAAVAGYTLPLGASNHPTTLKQRGDIAGTGFGGAKPMKKNKKSRKNKKS